MTSLDNSNEKFRLISFINETGKIVCGCKFSKFTGYPCRHELAVIAKQSIPFQHSNIQRDGFLKNKYTEAILNFLYIFRMMK